ARTRSSLLAKSSGRANSRPKFIVKLLISKPQLEYKLSAVLNHTSRISSVEPPKRLNLASVRIGSIANIVVRHRPLFVVPEVEGFNADLKLHLFGNPCRLE